MPIRPTITKQEPKGQITTEMKRIAAIIVAFVSVFGFLLKILFL